MQKNKHYAILRLFGCKTEIRHHGIEYTSLNKVPTKSVISSAWFCKMNKILCLASMLFLFMSSMAIAASISICVGPTASGDGSGKDWNNIAKWSTLTFARGNTYYLQSGTYTSKTLSTPNSGSTYIYIQKATESAHGIPDGWQPAYGAGTATFSGGAYLTISTDYWDISGVNGGGPNSWKTGHGIVFTSVFPDSQYFIVLPGARSYIFIRHIYFNQTGNTEAGPAGAGAGGIYSDSSSSLNYSTIEYCYFDNLGALPFFLRFGNNNIIQYNYTGNICGMSVFDYTWHCETLVSHGLNDLHFRWNFINECPSTGGFVKNNDGTTSDKIRIYGNVFANGVGIAIDGTATNWRIINNTFVNMTSLISITGTFGATNLFYNNLVLNSQISTLPGTHGYNWFSKGGCNCNSSGIKDKTIENITINYPNDCDKIIEIKDPLWNSYTTPQSDVNPITFQVTSKDYAKNQNAPGYDLCHDNTILPEGCSGENRYDFDAFGLNRATPPTDINNIPVGNSWTRGSYHYGILPAYNLRTQ